MLFFSLIVSALLLWAANSSMRFSGLGTFFFFLLGLLVIAGAPAFIVPFSPPAMILFLTLLIVLCFRNSLEGWRRRWKAFGVALMATSVATAGLVWNDLSRLEDLQQKYPLEQIANRLPPRPVQTVPARLDKSASSRLSGLEIEFDREMSWRGNYLRKLHASAVERFVRSEGFGAVRMYGPNEWNLKPRRRTEEKIEQPKTPDRSAEETLEAKSQPVAADDRLNNLHDESVVEFVNPDGFGYVKEQQVAGFQSHQFGKLPSSNREWSIASVDLVGLLLSETPRVYESKNLPRMDELKSAPTRPLDRFETEGLERIRGGEDLIVAQTASGVRMLGAIRSAKQCLQCHSGNRGDLLGAFTYRLERK